MPANHVGINVNFKGDISPSEHNQSTRLCGKVYLKNYMLVLHLIFVSFGNMPVLIILCQQLFANAPFQERYFTRFSIENLWIYSIITLLELSIHYDIIDFQYTPLTCHK